MSQNGNKDAADILQVAHTLAGSVHKSRHGLRVAVQLNKATTDAQFGLATCDRELDDTFSIPGDILQVLVNSCRKIDTMRPNDVGMHLKRRVTNTL